MSREGLSSKTSLSAIVLPSIGNIVFVSVLFVVIFGSGNGLLGDGDTGYHIKTGQVILQTWRIPAQDLYSYHTPALPWTAHEWLSEVIMAILFNWWGLTGVVFFFAILLAVLHWLLYRNLRNKSDDLLLCTLITVLATATSSTHWLARPHVFSLFLTVLWCYCLDRFQYSNKTALLLCLPLLMLVWVNLHGGFIIGLVLLGIYLLGNLLDSRTGRPELSGSYCNKVQALSLALIACLGVCFINPYGFEILLFPIRVTSDRFVMDHVTEFLPPNFHEVLPFKYMLLIVIGTLALSRSPLSFIDFALIVSLSYMSLYSARHISLFAVVLAPVLLKIMLGIMNKMPELFSTWYRKRTLNMTVVDAGLKAYLWPTFATAMVAGLMASGIINYGFDTQKFPVNAVKFLKREPIVGNMFNNDEFGDYMIFTLWPAYRVFMDGRSDMYGERFGEDYLHVAHVQPGWKEILKKYNITWVIFDTESALTAALKDQSDWQSIYSDRVATIFVKKDVGYASLLAKYPDVSLAVR